MGFKNFLHRNTIAKRDYNKKFRKVGISFEEYCEYIYKGVYNNISEFVPAKIFGVDIKRVGNCSFVQNVEEVLVEEVYKFKSNKENPRIIDCGTNIGLSLIYFKRLFPKANVIGFEPDDQIFNVCSDNLKAFKFDDIKLYNAAVWKEDGELSFLPDNSLGGMVVNEDKGDVLVKKVRALRLKNFLNVEVDFLKIDIEGAELEVLEDCSSELSNVKLLFVEYHSSVSDSQKLDKVLKIITDAGFRYYIKEAWDYMEHPFVEYGSHDNQIINDLQLNIFAYRKE